MVGIGQFNEPGTLEKSLGESLNCRAETQATHPDCRTSRRQLTAPANPLKAADLRPAPTASCRPSMSNVIGYEDALRRARIGRRYTRRRRCTLARLQRRRRHRAICPKWRNPGRVEGTTGVAEHAGIGRPERHAVDRRVACASRSRRWHELRICDRRRGETAEQQHDNKRMAKHLFLRNRRTNGYRRISVPPRILNAFLLQHRTRS